MLLRLAVQMDWTDAVQTTTAAALPTPPHLVNFGDIL
jgi:hypothetical protein